MKNVIVAVILACIAIAAGTGCETIRDGVGKIDWTPEEKPPVVTPEPEPEQPEQVNKGGDGLYKPDGNLWLLPERNTLNRQPFRATHLGSSGEYRDPEGTQLVRWHVWPNNIGPMSNRPINGTNLVTEDHPNVYHNNRIKIRGAKATASGSWFVAKDIYGQVVFKKQIIDRNGRQE